MLDSTDRQAVAANDFTGPQKLPTQTLLVCADTPVPGRLVLPRPAVNDKREDVLRRIQVDMGGMAARHADETVPRSAAHVAVPVQPVGDPAPHPCQAPLRLLAPPAARPAFRQPALQPRHARHDVKRAVAVGDPARVPVTAGHDAVVGRRPDLHGAADDGCPPAALRKTLIAKFVHRLSDDSGSVLRLQKN